MSASAILDEIKSDDLSQLLTSVRLKTSPGGTTQIPALDAYLVSVAQHHPLSSLNGGDVIEIQGTPASGKTHLVYFLLINCVLPSVHLSTDLGGWGKVGIVFDMDGSFDIVRFNQLLLSRLMRLLSSDMQLAQSIAKSSLERVRIFRPASTLQLAVTLAHLPKYHTAHFPLAEIGLIAIDSMSAHYWQDRFTVEYMQAPSSEPGQAIPGFKPPLQHVLTALQSFRLSHGPVIVMTNWGLNLANRGTPNTTSFYKQHLRPFPNPFSDAPRPITTTSTIAASFAAMLTLTHHITVSKTQLPRLRQGVPVDVAKMEDDQCRKEGVEKGEVIGLVRTPKSSDVGEFDGLVWVGIRIE